MTALGPRPDWLHPLPDHAPSAREALAACVEAFRYHEAPTALCPQCFPDTQQHTTLFAAARQARKGTCPPPESFAQIYFEHPNCVGGENTIKLFLPFGLQTMLTGTVPKGFSRYSYPEVLETTLMAGFWFWDPALIAPVRALAARLFEDWFTAGRFDLDGWPHPDQPADDLTGPGDDILHLCAMTLIDPADLIQRLANLHTPWSDDVFGAPGAAAIHPPFYVSVDTGKNVQPYKTASEEIARTLRAREAQAICKAITPDWLRAAFFRREARHPKLAAELSAFEQYYDLKMVETRNNTEAPILSDWPNLPVI